MGETKFNLNAEQKRAVDISGGPALVVAGAGTGKTKVIVERIAKLINDGIDRKNILALTFTEKAAQEMLDRVGELLKDSYATDLSIHTFNAFGQDMLREFAPEIGLSPDLQLVGDIGKVVLLRDHLDELELDYFAPVSQPDSQLGVLASYFSQLKQQLVSPIKYVEFTKNIKASDEVELLEKKRQQELARSYTNYIAISRSKNIIDYDDQIYLLVELLEKRPNVLKQLNQRFTHILVDEFQDTNPMQSRLLDLLSGQTNNIMAVGDDDQSIYGWRGATLANILDFTKRYPKTTEVTLVDNYRSGQPILDLAYKLIQNNNPDRLEIINKLDKRLISQAKEGGPPRVVQFDSFDGELDWIAREVVSRLEDGQDPSSIAILARRNAGAKRVSEMLDYYSVEHTLAGQNTDLYKHPLVANMIEALIAIVDPHNSSSMHSLMGGPLLKVDHQQLAELASKARREHSHIWDALKQNSAFSEATDKVASWVKLVDEKSVAALSYQILDESGLKDVLYADAENSTDAAFAVQALGQWFTTLREFQGVSTVGSSRQYIESLDSLRASGETLDDSESFDSGKVLVMSVHKAKGLEWNTVYIADCTEYSFPLKNSRSSLTVPGELSISSQADDHMAEERRLMYVAVTRAKSELILTHSRTHTGVTKRKPSRFLVEMFGDDLGEGDQASSKQTELALFGDVTKPATEVSLPSRMKSGQNLVLTASQANDYLRCPLDFYYRHVLNVPAEPNPSSAIGTLFHAIMQDINSALINARELPSLKDASQRMTDEWPQEGYLSAVQRDRAKKSAMSALGEVYERLSQGPIPNSAEEPFRVQVPNSKLILSGRIDVTHATDDGVEVVDYKTSTSATTPEKAKSQASGSKQLEMYALAWRQKHGEMPVRLSLDFVQTNQIGSVAKREKTIDNLEVKLATIADDILANKYPLGRSHDYCRHPISQ